VNITYEQAVAALMGDETIRGQQYQVFKRAPASLRDMFAATRGHGDKVFLVYEDERWSFAEVMDRVDALASTMVERYGIGPGDRVAIAMRNYPEWIVSFAAVTSIGAIAVCMNAWWTTDEMRYGLDDSGASLLIADSERAQRAIPIIDQADIRILLARDPQTEHPRIDHWDATLPRSATMPAVDIGRDDDAMILYTSGTTGFPKGAVSTHRSVLTALTAYGCRAAVNAAMTGATGAAPTDAPEPSMILAVPLFHVTGLVPVMLSSFAGGLKLVMMYKWIPERALELIERERVTIFVGVPTMTWDLLESPDFAKRDTSSLSNIGGGGAPAPPELVKRVDNSFRGGRPSIGYGMTETTAYGPQNAGDDYLRKPTSAGRALPIMELRVIDPDGNPLPPGEVGEICFRGANVIRGYWNKPEATAETIVDGWLRSGDLGRIDEEGFVFVLDRAKDMVLRAGENIYCAEVEAAIYEHPAVYEAAVFGIPHPRLGEEVAAAIVTKPGTTLNASELHEHLGDKIAGFKVPSVLDIRSERLPRNASGKILKRALRDQLVEKQSG